MLLMLKLILFFLNLSQVCIGVHGYAEIAEQMKCANDDCSEVISQGEARLTYKPRDARFLNLRKNDVVFVKSKNAGVKQSLWGGEVIGSDKFGFFPSTFIKEVMIFHKDKELDQKVNIEVCSLHRGCFNSLHCLD